MLVSCCFITTVRFFFRNINRIILFFNIHWFSFRIILFRVIITLFGFQTLVLFILTFFLLFLCYNLFWTINDHFTTVVPNFFPLILDEGEILFWNLKFPCTKAINMSWCAIFRATWTLTKFALANKNIKSLSILDRKIFFLCTEQCLFSIVLHVL